MNHETSGSARNGRSLISDAQKGGADVISRGYEGHAASQVRAYITGGNYVDIVKSRSKSNAAGCFRRGSR